MEFNNGDKVMLKDEPGEVFTVSQASESKFWIGDEQGRGWYVYYSAIKLVEEDEE